MAYKPMGLQIGSHRYRITYNCGVIDVRANDYIEARQRGALWFDAPLAQVIVVDLEAAGLC